MVRSLIAALALLLGLTTPICAQVKISALPGASALTGSEIFACVQGGTTSGCTATQIQTFASGGSIASGDVLSNVTGSSANAIGNTLSATIDKAIDNTQGDILYRGGSAWTFLGAGSAGQPLLSGGASANPSYGTLGTSFGGTGAVSANAGFNALSPMTTEGDFVYYHSSAATRLAVGTQCQTVQANATPDPIYGAGWCIVDRTSDGSGITSQATTLQNDSILTFSVAATTNYRYHAVVFLTFGTTDGWAVAMSGPSSPTSVISQIAVSDSTYATFGGTNTTFQTATATAWGASSTGGDATVVIDGVLINGSNAGSVTVDVSQKTSGAQATTVKAGSWIAYSKL